MARIFGFGRPRNNSNNPADCFPEILQKLPGVARGEQYHHLASKPHGNALACASGEASIYSDDTILVSITGQPVWSDAALQSVATASGHAEAVARAFRQQGKAMLDYLHGTFSLAVLEPGPGRTLLAIDRLGIQSMAYTTVGELVVFGSDTDTVTAHPEVSRELSPQGLFHYLYFHMVPSPDSIYLNIRKLLPGECIEFENGRENRSFYWHLDYREDSRSESVLAEELLALLEQSVQENCSDDTTGAFLSGGLDSSTVAGMLAKISGTTTDAYSIGFDADGYDEMEFARASARHFGVKLHEYYVTPSDVVAAVPKIAAAYDEPFGNASAIPAYYCARFAKENGTNCLLAGDGGDEIFAGNERYAKQKIFELYQRVPALLRRQLIEPLATGTPLVDRIPLFRKARSYIEQARLPMPERMESYNFLQRSPLDEILSPEFLSQIDSSGPQKNLADAYWRADSDSMLKRMLHMDLKITLADNDLRKVSRMCDLAGIAVRYPMLNEQLVEFSARVPATMLMQGSGLRSFYRNAMQGFLAPATLDKNKQGFGLPFGVWMSEHPALGELAYDSITDFSKRNYLNRQYTNKLLEEHRTGHAGYYGVMIWVIMMLEQWLAAHT